MKIFRTKKNPASKRVNSITGEKHYKIPPEYNYRDLIQFAILYTVLWHIVHAACDVITTGIICIFNL